MIATTATLRCAFCHDRASDQATATRAACGTVLHRECWLSVRSGPTLGCRAKPPVVPRWGRLVTTVDGDERRRVAWNDGAVTAAAQGRFILREVKPRFSPSFCPA